jgi:hypothetical protein
MTGNSSVRVVNLDSLSEVASFKASEGTLSSFFLTHNGKYVILINRSSATLWSLETKSVVYDFKIKQNSEINAYLSEDHKYIFLDDNIQQGKIWEFDTQREIIKINVPGKVFAAEFCKDNKYLAIAG